MSPLSIPRVRKHLKKGDRGFDGYKRVKGRKRHIATDTLGNLLAVYISPASQSDREGAKHLLHKLAQNYIWSQPPTIFADQGYQGEDLKYWVQTTLKWNLKVVSRPRDGIGQAQSANLSMEEFEREVKRARKAQQGAFVVLEKRWIVERTFAWLGNHRRLKIDYEQHPKSSEAWIWLAMTRLLLRKLA